MTVQSVRRAKAYYGRLREEFVNPRSHIRTLGKGAKSATSVELYFCAVNRMREVIFEMAKTKAQNGNGKVDFKGFVNYVLTIEDKALYQQWDIDDHDLWDLLATNVQEGYKITVSYNPQNDTFNATYMCNDHESKNAGYCLSAFAPTWYAAVRTLVFKHNDILGGVWPLDGQSVGNNWG